MKNPEVKTNIEVGGIIITEKLIKQIKQFQDNDNYYIDYIRNGIADAVCLIARKLADFKDEELQEAQDIITELSLYRDYFTELKKP